MGYTKEEILKIVKEKEIRFIRLQFIDILGRQKSVAITRSQLEKALDNQCMFDGSSIEGFVRIEESDMYLRPDLDSFNIYPWKPHQGRTARLICNVYMPDGTPFTGDPRHRLCKVVKEAADLGYIFNVGPECEFFLFHTDENGRPTTKSNDKNGYFDLGSIEIGEAVCRDICLALEDMDFEIEASHHEVAPAQYEIDFKYDEALTTADNIITFTTVVKYLAKRSGLHATFMPKPLYGISGSGMHINMSLSDQNGKNAFYNEKDQNGLSEIAYMFIAGILKHIKAITAICNPTVNSYKRLVPGYEAPVYIAWSAQNRSPLIRIPATRGSGTRLELRSPDPSANPYLAIAVCLAAGLDGIKNKLAPPQPVNANLYELTDKERADLKVENLPKSLDEAIIELLKDKLIGETLGEHITQKFVAAKREEWESYVTDVSEWEINQYIDLI